MPYRGSRPPWSTIKVWFKTQVCLSSLPRILIFPLTRFAYSSVCLTAVESMRIFASDWTTDWQGLHIPGCARPHWNLCVFVFLNEQLTDWLQWTELNNVCIFQGVLDRSRIYAYLMLNYLAMWPASQPSPTAFAFMLTIEGQQASQCTHVDG